MNEYQNRDLIVQFDMVRRKLKETGIDLSGIKIAMTREEKPQTITQQFLRDWKRRAQ